MRSGGFDRRLSDMFSVVADQRRLYVILILIVAPQSRLPIRHLAECLAVFETGQPPRQLESDAYETVRQSLVKGHLDTLIDAGVIERDGTRITRGETFTQYRQLVMTCLGITGTP